MTTLSARTPIKRALQRRSRRILRRSPLVAAAAWVTLVFGFSSAARGQIAAWALGDPVPRDAEAVVVASVVDGDTLRLTNGQTVRLLGLDTPETKHPDMAGPQALGPEAAARLRRLVEGRTVYLEADVTDRDHYGRLLRHVWVGRTLAAEDLLARGLARSMSIPPDVRHAERLRAAEGDAKAAGRGLWGLARPTPLSIFDADP